ncbi:branched-chain amino acid ABC transporter permease [Rhodoligotrophos defluvii]|uniref:branched-chain amino acid ABC transporter permease n=1 Tax=Rhodoligotrophos defluvii TaxID=2561934 RepID=UPI0010C9B673|nr:branched-chain amino acid ABC transporter permease [Rhodoligotrophos defluvii]
MTTSPSTTSRESWRKAAGGVPLSTRILAIVPWVIGLALLAYAYNAGGYVISIVNFALIYAIFVTGLNLFMGYAGQVSFGQNAFAGISGYTSAILTATYGWPPLAALVAGVVGALVAAAVIGYPTLRLKGHYLAMATLAVGLIVYEVAVEWDSVTAGYMGISGIPPMGIGGFEAYSDQAMLIMLAVVAVLAVLAAAGIRHSRLGRALVAIAGSEEAARALGINVARYKLIAFLISAAYAAIAGSLFVHVVGFVSPEVFGLHMVILAFTMLYIGGIGTILGPLIGAVIINVLPETFREFKDYQDLAYGAALILILIYMPRGIAGLAESWRERRQAALEEQHS